MAQSKRWLAIPQERLDYFPAPVDRFMATQEQAAKTGIAVLEEDCEQDYVYICYVVGVVRRPSGQYISFETAKKEHIVE